MLGPAVIIMIWVLIQAGAKHHASTAVTLCGICGGLPTHHGYLSLELYIFHGDDDAGLLGL
jgi:phosphoenolpyruvate-protein kinase (PTS system EI component)